MNAMAYITVWDSYTNDVSQHYLPVTIPSATIPGNPNPVIFKASMGKAIHEAICADTQEPLDDWEVVDTREVVDGIYVITLTNKTKTDVSTYSVRFAP
jgi:hypothetical protein